MNSLTIKELFIMDEFLKQLAVYCRNYCKENLEDFEIFEYLALKNMDKMRCPLSMACEEMDDAIVSAIEDWCYDNDYDIDDIWENYSTDDIFWEMGDD